MPLAVDRFMFGRNWDGGTLPPDVHPTKKLFGQVIGGIKRLEIMEEQEQAEVARKFEQLAMENAKLAGEIKDLQGKNYELAMRLKDAELKDRMQSMKLSPRDQNRLLGGPHVETEEERALA